MFTISYNLVGCLDWWRQ